MNTEDRSGAVAFGPDPLAVLLEQINDAGRGLEGLVRRFGNPGEEEIKPGLPVAMLAHFLEQTIVVCPACLQIEAEVEQRLAQHPR